MKIFEPVPANQILRAVARPAARLLREVPLHARMHVPTRGAGRGPVAVFLPCEGPRGAALLRIYQIATGLAERGWRTYVLPPQLTLAQRHRLIRRAAPDVLVMQGARHALNRPALYPGQRVIFDMDDADFHLPHLAEPVRRAMPQVCAVLAGSRYIARWCRDNGAGAAHVIWTGATVSTVPRPSHLDRPPVVAWAQSCPMDYTGEAGFVRNVMARLTRVHPDVRLRLFDRVPGPGGDDFQQWFEDAGVAVEWVNRASYSDYIKQFDDVSLGFAPLSDGSDFSCGKSFGKILAYLDRHVPVVASAVGEHGAFFSAKTGVVSNDPEVWCAEAARLLAKPQARQAMAEAAFVAFERELSLTAAVRRTDRVLRDIYHNQDYTTGVAGA